MTGLRAEHYREAVEVLISDPIVIEMVRGLPNPLEDLFWDDGTPRHDFMLAANREYAARGGTNFAHLGAVAEAIYWLKGGHR